MKLEKKERKKAERTAQGHVVHQCSQGRTQFACMPMRMENADMPARVLMHPLYVPTQYR